jgi:hypothetical protein
MAVAVFWAGLGFKSCKMMEGLKMRQNHCINMPDKIQVPITRYRKEVI